MSSEGWHVTEVVDQPSGNRALLPVLIPIFICYIPRLYSSILEPATYHSTILSSIQTPTNKSPPCKSFNNMFNLVSEHTLNCYWLIHPSSYVSTCFYLFPGSLNETMEDLSFFIHYFTCNNLSFSAFCS